MNANSERIIEIFSQAMAKPAEERAAFLASVFQNEPELREQVESLLHAEPGAREFLKAPPPGTVPSTPLVTEKPGERIGHYKLREKVGEGGCGVVYVADQEQPVRRRVALKVIKLGMDTQRVIARFEAERQALAMMDHPNIAKVLDAGATHTGRPYFVMELVRGIRITDFCDQSQCTTRRRLDLFIQVCKAIQHAHQKGIIHRDIKPSNILVTLSDGVPMPKVIDFGIAKATEGRLTEQTVYTALHEFVGTPAYMSPEQAALTSLDIDTRSDIYSLGVLLYELLTGKTPFDPKELLAAGLEEIRRTIREKEPLRPSTRLTSLQGDELTTTARRRHTDAPNLVQLVRGDLDWIVMKCLEKDRGRRYETAITLARDIEHHLNSEPVVACPPGKLYRFGKLVRRNKLMFAAAGVVATALVAGLSISSWMFFKEKAVRKRAVTAESTAQLEASKSKEVARFLEEMLTGVGPSVALSRDTRLLQDILSNTVQRLDIELTNQPAVQAELCAIITDTYHDLGLYREMERMAREALRLNKQCFGEIHPAVAESMAQLGDALRHSGDWTNAEPLLRRAVDGLRSLGDTNNKAFGKCLSDLGNLLSDRGDLRGAEAVVAESLEVDRRVAGPEAPTTITSMGNLGTIYWQQGRLKEAEPLMLKAYEANRRVLGPDDHHTLVTMDNLARLYADQHRYPEAAELYQKCIEAERRVLGTNHEDTLVTEYRIATFYESRGRFQDAQPLYTEILSARRAEDPESRATLAATLNLALNYIHQGRYADAEPLYTNVLAITRRKLGNDDVYTLTTLNALSEFYRRQGRYIEAEKFQTEALEGRRRVLGEEHFSTLVSMNNLALLYTSLGRYAEAEALHTNVLEVRRRRLGEENVDTLMTMHNLAFLYESQTNYTRAESLYEQALELEQRGLGEEAPLTRNTMGNLGRLYLATQRHVEAEPLLKRAFEVSHRVSGPDNPDTLLAMDGLAQAHLAGGRFAEAETLARECLVFRERRGTNEWETSFTRSLLGAALLGQKKYAAAEPLLLSGYDGMKERLYRMLRSSKSHLKETLQDLVRLYEQTNRLEQAAEWKQKLAEFQQAAIGEKTVMPKQ